MSTLASIAKVSDARNAHRANVFLTGVLSIAGSSFPVRIRNLSATGALVDGKDLPATGDAVRLQRGPYSVVAEAMWRKPGTCGLRFSSTVPVQEWIAYGTGHKGQQRVDDMIASVRAGAAPVAAADIAAARSTAADRLQTVEQLRIVADQLEEVAAKFAAIPAVVEQGMAGLQTLDIARQTLVDISTRIGFGER